MSSSAHRPGIASHENIFTMPGSEIIQYDQENKWLHTSSFQSGKKIQRKRKARQKKLTKISLNELEPCAVSAQKIEQTKNMVRTHQDALDFDILFCSEATAIDFDENRYKRTSKKGGK